MKKPVFSISAVTNCGEAKPSCTVMTVSNGIPKYLSSGELSSERLDELFSVFQREKPHYEGCSEVTADHYGRIWRVFRKANGELTKKGVKEFIMRLREKGRKASTANTYITGLQSFINWLGENEYIRECFKLKRMKEPRTVLKRFTEKEVRALVNFKPHGIDECRIHVVLCFLVDTGTRIGEALSLRKDQIDWEELTILVNGKSGERVIPISSVCKEMLWKHANSHSFPLVFCTSSGKAVLQSNARRDFRHIAKKLNIVGPQVTFHKLRHNFAADYVRNGGSLFHLMKALGHQSLTNTWRYVELDVSDLVETHNRVRPLLKRLKSQPDSSSKPERAPMRLPNKIGKEHLV